MSKFITELTCIHCGRHVSRGKSGDGRSDVDDLPEAAGRPTAFSILATTSTGLTMPGQSRPLAQRPLNHWRYAELLPLRTDCDSVRLAGRMHADYRFRAAGQASGCASAFRLKDEGRNPTASFKDRASSVGVAHALQVGAKTIACASTGNAASSLAGHAALGRTARDDLCAADGARAESGPIAGFRGDRFCGEVVV